METVLRQKMVWIGSLVCAAIIALIPFHAFLTIWASTLLGHYTALRLWKEVLMVMLAPCAILIVWRDTQLRRELRKDLLFRLFWGYIWLHILLGVIAVVQHQVNLEALGYALIINLRLPFFFMLTWIFASQSIWLRTHVRKIVVIPGLIVVVFGLMQAFVLPVNTLSHFGYSNATIPAFQTVDQNLSFVRIQSTLRGSNPLGAYLVLLIAVLVGIAVYAKKKDANRARLAYGILLIMTLAALYYTYSRSAYIGAGLAVMVIGWRMLKTRQLRLWALGLAICLTILGGGAVLLLRHNTTFENTFFHTDQHSLSSKSSNQVRASALEDGLHDVLHEPLGRGPGTAGPASVHNDHPARIAEDYYLQIGQEVGWVGLYLFLAIIVILGRRLWSLRDDWLASALLASLIGISFINILSHAWADDTLAFLWWGLAGIATHRNENIA